MNGLLEPASVCELVIDLTNELAHELVNGLSEPELAHELVDRLLERPSVS